MAEKKKIKSPEEVAQESSDFLKKKIKYDQKQFAKAIKNLENKIIDMASDFETKGGFLISDKDAFAQAQKIHSDLQIIFKETYDKTSIRSVKGYNNAVKMVESNLTDMGFAVEFTGIDKTMIDVLQNQSLEQYAIYGQQAQQKIALAMYNAVLSGGSFSSLVDSVSSILTGSLSKQGVPMEVYAEQWANDGLMNFHQEVLSKKGKDAGLTSFLYVGNIMETTRQFCRDRVGKIFTKEEINSWDDQKWQGKSGSAMTNRGGYNCRHHWQPVLNKAAKEIKKKELET